MAFAWHLVSRPASHPTHGDFELREYPLPPLDPDMIRVRNRWLSVDPYMRARMSDAKSYWAPYALGQPLEGGAIGEVIESRCDCFSPGDFVTHMAGWRDEAVLPATAATKLLDDKVPAQYFLGVLGMPGVTALLGLDEIAKGGAGDTLFVSAAAGAVGSAVVQLAKARGMTVIGSAGGPKKCDLVRELGADAVIDYRAAPDLQQALTGAAPDGIDVYFDNVGGRHLDAALWAAHDHARFVMCGMIESYNSAEPVSLMNIRRIITARVMMKGFIISDHWADAPKYQRQLIDLFRGGALQALETIHEGLEAAPNAFLSLFSGGNAGKTLIRL